MGNKNTVQRIFDEIVNGGNLELIDELFDSSYTSDTPQGTFDLAGFKNYVGAWRTAFPDLHTEVVDIIEEGDAVAWSIRAKGTNTGEFMGMPATGKSMDNFSLNMGWFRDGRAVRHVMVMDQMQVMQQLGMMPEAASAS